MFQSCLIDIEPKNLALKDLLKDEIDVEEKALDILKTFRKYYSQLF